jgi:hypothetical protein
MEAARAGIIAVKTGYTPPKGVNCLPSSNRKRFKRAGCLGFDSLLRLACCKGIHGHLPPHRRPGGQRAADRSRWAGWSGVLSGMFGVGGGFLTTPLLIFYGIPPTVAVASATTQITGSPCRASMPICAAAAST